MIIFRAWEIKKIGDEKSLPTRKLVPEIYFRHVEKIILYLTKYIVQTVVFVFMKYWFIFLTKTKIWAGKNLPKIYNFFDKKSGVDNSLPQTHSFLRRAVLESKAKIRKIKENVKKEHGAN